VATAAARRRSDRPLICWRSVSAPWTRMLITGRPPCCCGGRQRGCRPGCRTRG
jgi:hypothetical protein